VAKVTKSTQKTAALAGMTTRERRTNAFLFTLYKKKMQQEYQVAAASFVPSSKTRSFHSLREKAWSAFLLWSWQGSLHVLARFHITHSKERGPAKQLWVLIVVFVIAIVGEWEISEPCN
jgi:hypothetical protein